MLTCTFKLCVLQFCTSISQIASSYYFPSCFFSPNGKKIRSKPELVRYLGPKYDLTCFDYRTGKIIMDKAKPARRTKPYDMKV